jgi:hypothetical protein
MLENTDHLKNLDKSTKVQVFKNNLHGALSAGALAAGAGALSAGALAAGALAAGAGALGSSPSKIQCPSK